MLIKGKENLIILDPRHDNPQRRRYTVAALLGHLIIPWHTDTIYLAREKSSFKTEDALEMEALQFAAYLLMPREVLADDLSASTVSLEALSQLAADKYAVSVFALSNSLVDLYPDKYAVVQNDGQRISKTYQGTRAIRSAELDPHSLAAGFRQDPPKEREIRTAKLAEKVWFQKARPGTYVLEESVYDPNLDTVLTLLTLP